MPTVEQVPYEFLIRWRHGEQRGAHVVFANLVTNDDGSKQETPLGPKPVDIGLGDGFPLDEILGTALTASLSAEATATATVNTLTKEKAELTAQLQAAQSRVAELEYELTSATAA